MDNGVCTSDREEIEGEILKFFFTLYSPKVTENPFVEGIDWSPILSREDVLVVPFTIEEIKKIVLSCNGNNAPGANRFSMAFFSRIGI